MPACGDRRPATGEPYGWCAGDLNQSRSDQPHHDGQEHEHAQTGEHGEVVEEGAPTELVAAGQGRYSALHEAWVESLA